MGRIIMHIDLNCFFATCEEIDHPEYVGKPLAVAGKSRRGIVSTANYEARKYGVHAAMPTYQALKLCPQLIVEEGHYQLYELMSKEFMLFLRNYSKVIEQASIDEAYVDMTDNIKNVQNVEQYFKDIQMALYHKTKLKCSIGVASTKFLAKMASDMKKPMGVTFLRKKDIEKMLWPLPIEDTFGIGKKTAPELRKLGINTIDDLAHNNNPEVEKCLGKFYSTIQEWIHGEGDDVVEVEQPDPKSIGHAETMYEDSDDYVTLSRLLEKLSKIVSDECIHSHRKGNTVQIVIKNSEFKVVNRSIALNGYFNDFQTIYNAAIHLFDKNWDGSLTRMVGVTLQNLESEKDLNVQMTFFDYSKYEEENQTKLLINEFNRKTNSKCFMRASEVIKSKK